MTDGAHPQKLDFSTSMEETRKMCDGFGRLAVKAES